MSTHEHERLEQEIGRWRTFVTAHGSSATHLATVEEQLRRDTRELGATGLDADEAFLVALRRAATADEATLRFARERCVDLWASPTTAGDHTAPAQPAASHFVLMLTCGVLAAVAIKTPALLGHPLGDDTFGFYARNVSLLVLPFLALYLAVSRGLRAPAIAALAGVFAAAAAAVNLYPFEAGASTLTLSAIHLPIVLWLTLGVAFVSGEWRSAERRMEYVRFTGEWLVNYALIALGGGVLTAITIGVFQAIDLDATVFVQEWLLPCGAAGAVIVAAWLADTRRTLTGGMAPMLARVFTPLFAAMLLALLAGVAWAGGIISIEREVLILFDLLLVLVLALVLYALSARDRRRGPGLFDRIQFVLVACALAVDVVALVNIAARLAEYGFSANRTAAIGLNLILLANLGWSAALQRGFIRSRRTLEAVEGWQMSYLPVYALWAAIVALAFPVVFRFA